MNDDALTYLQGDSQGPKRDMIARYYYEVAQGDPKSGPVSFAVLLAACAEQFAKTPKELTDATTRFDLVMAQARELERRMMERVEKSNASVIATFKDEVTRASSHLRITAQHSERIVKEGQQIAETMQKLLVQGESLANELYLTKLELKNHNVATKEIAEATANNKAISESTKAIVSHLTLVACVNWITVGVIIGFILTLTATQVPWWAALTLFTLAIGLLQWAARNSWNFVVVETEKFPSPMGTSKDS
jgi:F0F1-type ATP synthase assembly protein I